MRAVDTVKLLGLSISLVSLIGCTAHYSALELQSDAREPLPLRAALVMTKQVSETKAVLTPCSVSTTIEIGKELEQHGVQALSKVFESVELVRNATFVHDSYDVVVELRNPRMEVWDSSWSCGVIQSALWSIGSLGLIPLIGDHNTPVYLHFDAKVFGRRGQELFLNSQGNDAITGSGKMQFSPLSIMYFHVRDASREAILEGLDRLVASLSNDRLVAYARNRSNIPSEPSLSPKVVREEYNIEEPPKGLGRPHEHDLAVVIGVEQYQGVPRAEFATRDARLVKAYLLALGYREGNIEFLLNDRATFGSLRRTFQSWLPNRVQTDSRVVVYFSGHGAPDPVSGVGYLVPYDGDPSAIADTGVPLPWLYENLGKLPAREIVVLLDSCFSGLGGRSVLPPGIKPLVNVQVSGWLPPNITVLSASEPAQISTTYPIKGHGLFTFYLLKAVKEGKSTVADLYVVVRPAVEDQAKRQNVRQTPMLMPELGPAQRSFAVY